MDFMNALGRISNADVFARTHAVDLFIHNDDRHRGNYLYLDIAGDVVARVIDFSHCLLTRAWPLPDLPMPPCNTTNELPLLLAQDTQPYVKPTAVLDTIRSLPDEWMRDTLDELPQAWKSREISMELREWWVSVARRTRVNASQLALP